jgi:hypothetical protein
MRKFIGEPLSGSKGKAEAKVHQAASGPITRSQTKKMSSQNGDHAKRAREGEEAKEEDDESEPVVKTPQKRRRLMDPKEEEEQEKGEKK